MQLPASGHQAEMARMEELFRVSSLRSPEEVPEDEAVLGYEEIEAAVYQAQAAGDEPEVRRLMRRLRALRLRATTVESGRRRWGLLRMRCVRVRGLTSRRLCGTARSVARRRWRR